MCSNKCPKGTVISHARAAALPAHPVSLDFSQLFDKLVFPQETDKSIPTPKKNNQGKIFKILLEGILLTSELACPQGELLGDLNKLFEQFEQCLMHRKGIINICYFIIAIHMKP